MTKVFCIIGKNSLLIDEKIKELAPQSIIISYSKDFSSFFLELQKNLNQRLLDQTPALVIKNIEKLNKENLEKVVYAISNSEQKIIFVLEKEPVELGFLLRKNKIKFEIIHIAEPKGYKDLDIFLREFFKKHKIKVSEEIIELLKENYVENFDLLFQDLNKIVNLEIKELKTEVLKKLITLQPNTFKIHDLFLDKKWPQFIHSYKKFIFEDKSKDHYKSLSTLHFLFNSLVKIYLLKNNKNAKISGHFFYINKLKEKANKLKNDDIKKMIFAIAQSERKLKKFYLNIKDLPEDIFLNYYL